MDGSYFFLSFSFFVLEPARSASVDGIVRRAALKKKKKVQSAVSSGRSCIVNTAAIEEVVRRARSVTERRVCPPAIRSSPATFAFSFLTAAQALAESQKTVHTALQGHSDR